MTLFFLGVLCGAAGGGTAIYYLLLRDFHAARMRALDRYRPPPTLPANDTSAKVIRLTNRNRSLTI